MPEWMPIPLPQESYQALSLTASAQRLQNLYLEANPENAKSPFSLYPTPGLLPWGEFGDGPIRGMVVMGAYVFIVSGTELYRSDWNQNTVLVPGEIAGTHNCRMIENGTHVVICTEDLAYYADVNGISMLPQAGLNGATYQDGYGIFTQRGGQNVWLSGLDDLTSINGLDFTTADRFPDHVVGVISDHGEPWVFKGNSTEIFVNTGAASFPFSRASFIERGCGASASIAKTEHRVLWLGDDLAVYASSGYQPQQISTPAIEQLIRAVSDPSAAIGFTYKQTGHAFYVLTFASLTIVYDLTTGKWHERRSPNESRWRANHYVRFTEKDLVGDFETGDIYELDPDTYTDDGTAREYLMDFPPLHADGRRAVLDEFQLDMEAGVGTESGTGSNPAAWLLCSDDGAKTWSTPREARLGQQGEYGKIVNWTRLGAFRQRILRVRCQEPVKFAVVGAKARMEPWH